MNKLSIEGINNEMNNSRQIWQMNGPDLISGSQSVVAIEKLRAEHMELAMAISGATWTADQAHRSTAHITSQDHYRKIQGALTLARDMSDVRCNEPDPTII